ncbi:MAG: hypothetical protein ACK5QH_12930 [Rubrivivax sp.]|jgi:hypothetical protein
MTAPTPSAAGLRQRRQAAARALQQHPRRAQLSWADLAAWPAWASLPVAEQRQLALRCGAWRHAAAWRRCISGALLQQLPLLLGGPASARLLSPAQPAPGPDTAASLPPADSVADWLLAEGQAVLLASVPSPLLRLLLRETLAPADATAWLAPPLEATLAQRVLAEARR